MNILVTNDDGINADGLFALKVALEKVGKVYVVAPDRPRSACGHSITLHKPLRADQVQLRDGSFAYASNGTPSDCVSLALRGLVKEQIDLVVAGINKGPNLGWDLTYSGTVSAAMEGAIMGVQSFSISVTASKGEVEYSFTASFAAHLALMLAEKHLPSDTLLNVNVPALPAGQIRGVRITRQGQRRYTGNVVKRVDPSGRAYYWLGDDTVVDKLDEGTDVKAVVDGYISVCPIHLDLTDYNTLREMFSWGIQDLDVTKLK
ncbi:MAG: 5'/3'-nucleotidase SurE [Armatimonadota bacterium]